MSEIALTIIKVVYLALLWLFISLRGIGHPQ
jgi:uncharacterized membrane protein YesL